MAPRGRGRKGKEVAQESGAHNVRPDDFDWGRRGRRARGEAQNVNVEHEVNQETQIPQGRRRVRNVEVVDDVNQLVRGMGVMELVISRFQTIRPPRFSGTEDGEKAAAWLKSIKRLFNTLEYPPDVQLKLAICQLKDRAQLWWETTEEAILQSGERITWEVFCSQFTREYSPPSYYSAKEAEFNRLTQGNMTVGEYASQFSALLAYVPHVASSDRSKLSRFMQGLNRTVCTLVVAGGPNNYADAVEKAKNVESTLLWAKPQSVQPSYPLGSGSNVPMPVGAPLYPPLLPYQPFQSSQKPKQNRFKGKGKQFKKKSYSGSSSSGSQRGEVLLGLQRYYFVTAVGANIPALSVPVFRDHVMFVVRLDILPEYVQIQEDSNFSSLSLGKASEVRYLDNPYRRNPFSSQTTSHPEVLLRSVFLDLSKLECMLLPRTRLMRHPEELLQEAAAKVQPSSKREGFSVLPNVKWDEVGGLHSLKQVFDHHIVKGIKYPETFEHFGVNVESGILLGKTMIAKAVAGEAGANFIHIKGPELLNKYVGESELAVRTIFMRARTCSPCILFFDEVDALTTDRGREGGGYVEKLVNQLLLGLDGDEERRGVYVIGATNRPEVVDPAFLRPGRFGKLLYVPLPCPEERGMILKSLATKMKIDTSVDLMAIGKDSLCENFSGADLSELLREATSIALEDI